MMVFVTMLVPTCIKHQKSRIQDSESRIQSTRVDCHQINKLGVWVTVGNGCKYLSGMLKILG